MSTPRRKPTKTEVQPSNPAAPKKGKSVVHSNVRVRFESDANRWSVMDENGNGKTFFEFGYMKNVTFSNLRISNGMKGCGHRYDYVGIATGDLVMGKYHKDQTNLTNLGFNGENFVNIKTQEVFRTTPLLHLFPERKAMAKSPTA